MSAYDFSDGIKNFAIYVKIVNAKYLAFAIFLISNSNAMTYLDGIRIIIFWHKKVIPAPDVMTSQYSIHELV